MNKIKTRRSPGTKILGAPGIKERNIIYYIYIYVYIYILYMYIYIYIYIYIIVGLTLFENVVTKSFSQQDYVSYVK